MGKEFYLQLFAEEAGSPADSAGGGAVPVAGNGAVPGVVPAAKGPEPGAGAAPAQGQAPAAPPDKEGAAAEFNLAQAFADARSPYDPGQAGEIAQVLKGAGVKENAVANKLAAWVLTQQQRVEEALLDETLREFGGTRDNPGERLKEARAQAGRAMEALEKKVPGLRDSLRQSVLDADVRVLKALAAVGEMVGEDGNFMGGVGNAGASSVASLYFPKS
jgi:hypothetical protein